MKNRFLKGAHISERKVRELLKLFCDDLTATQIAGVSGVSRITVNAYLKLVRTLVARHCEERNPLLRNNGTLPLASRGEHERELNGHPEEPPKKPMYGLFREGSQIYTHEFCNLDYHQLNGWLKGSSRPEPAEIQRYHLDLFNGIVDFNTIRLFRMPLFGEEAAKTRFQPDEIDLFWGLLKSRMIKFRGLNSSTLYLHVKETEFRYNYRERDIFEMIMEMLHQRPLHLSRMAE